MEIQVKEELIKAFVNMEEDLALDITNEMIKAGIPALTVLDACTCALEMIGKDFENGSAFIPELVMSGRIMDSISEVIKPGLAGNGKKGEREEKGKVLIGTVAGDIHYIGKNIVTFMLGVNGYEVIDLGVDVPKETFVERIAEHKPHVVGLSSLLTTAFDSMTATIAAIDAAGLRNDLRIMIGGGPIDEEVKKVTGADAFGKDAVEAVNLVKAWRGDNA